MRHQEKLTSEPDASDSMFPHSGESAGLDPTRPVSAWHWRFKLWGGWALINAVFLWHAFSNLMDSRAIYDERAKTDTQNMAAALKEAVKGGLDATEISLHSLAHDRWIRDILLNGSTEDRAEVLNTFSEKHKPGRTFHYFDETGRLDAVSGTESDAPPSIAEGNVFRKLQSEDVEQLIVSRPLLSERSKEWSIILAHRLNDADGHFRGVVSARIPLDYFYGLFLPLSLGPAGAVSVRDLDNNLVARVPKLASGTVGEPGLSNVMRPATAKDLVSGTYVSNSQYDGVHRTVSFERVEHFPLNVFVAIAASDYLAPWFQERQKAQIESAIFAAVTGLLAWLVAIGIRKQDRVSRQVLGQERNFRTLLETASDALVVLNTEGVIQSVNRRAANMLQKERDDLRGMPVDHILQRHQRRLYPGMFSRLCNGRIPSRGTPRRNIILRRPDGTRLPVTVAIRTMDSDQGPLLVLDVRDMSEQRAAEERMRFLASHDALTGLPNRQRAKELVRAILQDASKNESTVAIVHIGLDHFKSINDSVGHAAGDLFLKSVANRLTERRPRAEAVSRISGDEFMLAYSASAKGRSFASLLEQLQVHLRIPMNIDGKSLSTTCSVGVALYPQDAETFEDLSQKATVAMHQAKADGRNKICFFDAETNAELHDKHNLSVHLRRALWGQELALHYQPILDLSTGKLAALEALLRWTHPELGVVSPDRFIPVAEETGLIVEIGAWVLNEACRQSALWKKVGINVPIAVNLSAVQFQRQNVEEIVTEALRHHDISPENLQLELTESIFLQDTEHVLGTLARLKAKGVQISIDDFGTGYSSLSYLRRLNANKLKIDQSFIRNLSGTSKDVAIVKAIIQMAHTLGLVVVAEGVETLDILNMLRDLDCDSAQGYFFARPAAAAALNFDSFS